MKKINVEDKLPDELGEVAESIDKAMSNLSLHIAKKEGNTGLYYSSQLIKSLSDAKDCYYAYKKQIGDLGNFAQLFGFI